MKSKKCSINSQGDRKKEKREKLQNKQETKDKLADNPYYINYVNVNDLNTPIKRDWKSELKII